MINEKDILAIIPARGGSKGVPRKNIKDLCGKPLIQYTIEAAKKSKYIDRIIVSSDDSEILNTVKNVGIDVPFIRPNEISKDDTPSMDVIMHCLEWLRRNENYIPKYICLLQCTSPFRDEKHIDEAIEKMISENGSSIVSVCESEVSPYCMKKIENGKLIDFINNNEAYSRRQELPKVYQLNGAIYISEINNLLENKKWYTDNTLGYVMDSASSLDIDTSMDFKIAEVIMKEKKNEF